MDKRKLLKNKIELECSQYCRNILRKRNGTFKDDTYSSIATKTKTQLSTNFKKGSIAINKAEIYTFASTENLSFTTPSLSKFGMCMAIKTSMGTVIKEPSDIYKYNSL